jgi:salicylate hydroxylase
MSDGSRRRAELVVAADGLHSVARSVLNGPDEATFSGQVAWRATVENRFDHPDEVHVAMGPGRHLVSYPIREGRFVNLVAVEERQAWAPEGWHERDDPANLRAAFSGFQGRAAQMIDAVEAATLWGLHLHPVAPVWQREGVVLLGDAAHPTLPFLAQGANMALEDAFVLAELAMSGGADWAGRYQDRRFKRVARVVKAAERTAWRYHLRPGLVRKVAHLGLGVGSRFAPGRMLGAYDWLYGCDVTRAPHQP